MDRGWYARRRSDIEKRAPAGLDRLKMPLRWRERSPVQEWLPLYGATSCASSYRWPGMLRQPSLKCLTRLHRSPGKVQRRHEQVGKEFGGTAMVRRRESASYVFNRQAATRLPRLRIVVSLPIYARILCIVVIIIINARTLVLYLVLKCKNVVFCNTPPLSLLE